MAYKEMDVCIHMAFFWHETNNTDSSRVGTTRSTYVLRVVNEYLSKWDVRKLDLFIHTNSDKASTIRKDFQLHDRFTVTFVTHDLSYEHNFNLTWKPRAMLYTQQNSYDAFAYIEDDIGFPFETFCYWLKYKDILHMNNLDVGFVRVETNDSKEFFCTDVLIPCQSPIRAMDRVFAWNHQNYCAFWICDKEELKRFIASPYWKYHGYFPEGPTKPFSPFIQESSAIGFKMSYRGSFYPLDDTNTSISDMCFVHHLPNNFINSPAHEQGKFAVKRMTDGLFS